MEVVEEGLEVEEQNKKTEMKEEEWLEWMEAEEEIVAEEVEAEAEVEAEEEVELRIRKQTALPQGSTKIATSTTCVRHLCQWIQQRENMCLVMWC